MSKKLTFRQVAALAEREGLPGKAFAQIAKGESGFDPMAVGHDPGGTRGLGLFQITTKYNDDVIRRFGGRKAMLNPVNNAKAAAAIYKRQGIKAWYGTKYLTDPKAHYKGGDVSLGNLQDVDIHRESVADPAGFQQARSEYALNRLLTAHHGPQGSVMQRVGLLDQTTAPDAKDFTRSKLVSSTTQGDRVTVPGASGGPRGRVRLAAGANRAGVGVKPIVTEFVGRAAGIAGIPITITTGTNHNQMTVNGNVSDHWDGHAGDIAVPVDSAKGDRIAAAALVAAGVAPKKAKAMAKQGGLFTINHGGRRIQVIWKTYSGGNHHNHVHVGIR